MVQASLATPPLRRRLEFGADVPCPPCKGSGKERAQFDRKTGRFYRSKCGYCSGRGFVSRLRADRY